MLDELLVYNLSVLGEIYWTCWAKKAMFHLKSDGADGCALGRRWCSLHIVRPSHSEVWSRIMFTSMQWLTRGKKVQSRGEREIWNQFLHFREEKEKSDTNFSNFERRKRNMKLISPISRGEREIWIPFLSFEKRKRNQKKYSQLSRRDRERYILCLSFEKRKRNLT